MSLVSLIASACEAVRCRLRGRADVDLLAFDDHMLADLGLRRADLRAGLWQSRAVVDGEPSAGSGQSRRCVFDDGWVQLF